MLYFVPGDLDLQTRPSKGSNTSAVWIWHKFVQWFPRYVIHKQKNHTLPVPKTKKLSTVHCMWQKVNIIMVAIFARASSHKRKLHLVMFTWFPWRSRTSSLVKVSKFSILLILQQSYGVNCNDSITITASYQNEIISDIYTNHHHTTTVLRPFSGTIRVSWCQKRTSGLYSARGD